MATVETRDQATKTPLPAGSSELIARVRRGLEMYEAGLCTARQLAGGMRKLAEQLDPPKESEELRRKVERVFEVWRAEMGKGGSAKLTRERRAKVEARLKEGYSAEEIIDAVRNCAASDFHRGANERGTAYNDLTLICRTGSKLEQFRDMGPHPVKGGARATLPAAEPAPSLQYKGPNW